MFKPQYSGSPECRTEKEKLLCDVKGDENPREKLNKEKIKSTEKNVKSHRGSLCVGVGGGKGAMHCGGSASLQVEMLHQVAAAERRAAGLGGGNARLLA